MDNADLPGETWKSVPGFEGLYEVSDHGRVRGLSRVTRTVGGGTQVRPARILRAALKRNGYLQVQLRKDGRTRHANVHRLVCEAFHGLPAAGQVVRHLDGSRTNNVPSNLAWGTYGENAQDSIRHRTHKGTSQTHCIRGHSLDVHAYTPPKRPGQRYCQLCAKMRKRGEI